MKSNWLAEQLLAEVSQFDKSMSKVYPNSEVSFQSANNYISSIGFVCNYIDAANKVPWQKYFSSDSLVLDLGCGGGWLSAMLSKFDEVKKVYALDSSHFFLNNMFPQVLDCIGGLSEKIVPIEGVFQPLLFDDAHLDVVVASSSLHHADNLDSLLKEIRRSLKVGGYLFVINETPRSNFRFLISALMASIRILRDLFLQRYMPLSPSISSSGYLYDPALGDRDYPLWYWKKAFISSGFELLETINTGLPTVKNGNGRSLIHFVCKAI